MKAQTLRRAATIGLGLAIIVLSFMPTDAIPSPDIANNVDHLLAYMVWTLLAVISPRDFRRLTIYVAIIFLTGVAIEMLQPFFGRHREFGDVIANTLGILLGAGIGHVIRARLYSTK